MATTPTIESDTTTEPLPPPVNVEVAANNLTGSADGDAVGNPVSTPSGAANGVSTSAANPPYSVSQQNDGAALATSSSGSTTPTTTSQPTGNSPPKPGRRLQNPLGDFSSYTYQLSLYMVTPEGYKAFAGTGRKDINVLKGQAKPQIVTLIQSGGINNTTNTRASGFELDFYIDDLSFKTTTSPKGTSSAANITETTFTVYEPYGFSFLSKLRQATLELLKNSSVKNATDANNPVKQIYILGIRFQGYDHNGEIVNSQTTFARDTFNPSSTASGVFERFYDINITSVKFKLDGKMSTYKISAVSYTPQVAMTTKRGMIDIGLNLEGTTVDEVLQGPDGLFTKLNAQQVLLSKQTDPNGKTAIQIPNQYYVRYVGGAETSIKTASLVTLASKDKFKLPMSGARTTAQVNEKVAARTNPDTTKRTITFKNDTPILQALDNIILQSNYLEDGLKVVYTDALQPNDPNDPDAVKQPKNTAIQWYNVGSDVECLGWDNIVGDWAYKITYVIQPYATPATISPYIAQSSKYPGPFKRYEYWYTGKNSEVLSFEQTLDNAYYMSGIAGAALPSTQAAGVSQKAGVRAGGDPTGSLNEGKEAQNSYLTSLYSPKDWATAKITILGDPDFLVKDAPPSAADAYNQYYGPDGYSINIGGGQIFIELNFNEGVDYQNTDGLLTLNQSVTFWQDPSKISTTAAKIKGISYMVLNVMSTFQGGKFTQVLTCNITNFPQDDQTPVGSNAAGARDSATPTSAATQSRQSSLPLTDSSGVVSPTAANTNTSLLPDPSVIMPSASAQQQQATNPAVILTNQITSPTGGFVGPNIIQPAFDPLAGTASSVPLPSKPVADDEATVSSTNAQIITAASVQDGGGRETIQTFGIGGI